MSDNVRYIELKSGYSDDGPAWIARVRFSKSKKSIYFNNMLLKSLKGSGIGANYYDLESGDQYWVSGVKKQEWNRHTYGKGDVMIEKSLIDWFCKHINYLEKSFLIPIDDLPESDIQRLNQLENS
ncbi:MAG: hypothetical protein GY703_20510 [Gammaproteobacteria bacterium]|nr:hypothetical protein [Gammaproteobacteria bacterium]